MANVINTNISSLNAQRNLSTSQSSLATSLQRLSTGLRINSAKDDAAGQAISTRMTAQINGMQQASRNANDGISMSQTAEGAMGSINDILLRMRDLSVQASNGTNGTAERATIQNEVDQLYQEIDRISGDANFNGIKLLDGSAKSNSFQIGANAGQTISFSIGEVSTKSMKLSGSAAASGDISSGRIKADGLDTLSNASLSINGTAIKFDAKDVGTGNQRSASEVVKAINNSTSTTGVTASASNVVKGNAAGTGVLAAGDLTIAVQNADGTAGEEISIAASKNMDELVANINAQVGGITAALDDKGVLTLSNDTGAAITIKAQDANVARAAGLDSATATASTGATYNGYISLSGQNGAEIKLGGEDLAKLGLNASTGSGKLSGSAAIVDQATDADTAIGELNTAAGKIASTDKVKINGVELNQDAFNDALTAGEKAQAINSLTAQTGVKATATTEAFVDLSNVKAGDKYAINGKTYTLAEDDADMTQADAKTAEQKLVDQIQTAFAAGTSGGVNAEIDAKSGKARLFSSTGQDIVIGGDPAPLAAIAAGTDPATITANAGTISISTAADSAGKVLNTATPGADPDTDPAAPNAGAIAIRGKISLTSESGGPIKLEDGNGGDGLKKLGLVEQGGSADPILGGKLDVSTAKGAQDAIGRIDKAIAYVSEQRANMGAVQNRLSTTVSNLSTATENASAARSRIQDADFATETANMTRGQILQQAGTAMLAQANSLPNGVLSLLRG